VPHAEADPEEHATGLEPDSSEARLRCTDEVGVARYVDSEVEVRKEGEGGEGEGTIRRARGMAVVGTIVDGFDVLRLIDFDGRGGGTNELVMMGTEETSGISMPRW